MRFPRASYIPAGAVKVASKKSSAVAYLSERLGRLVAIGFRGKADKPAFHYSFRSPERRAQYVTEWMQRVDASEQDKRQRLAERRAKLSEAQTDLKPGDVLRSSWGYDQTNIDY